MRTEQHSRMAQFLWSTNKVKAPKVLLILTCGCLDCRIHTWLVDVSSKCSRPSNPSRANRANVTATMSVIRDLFVDTKDRKPSISLRDIIILRPYHDQADCTGVKRSISLIDSDANMQIFPRSVPLMPVRLCLYGNLQHGHFIHKKQK